MTKPSYSYNIKYTLSIIILIISTIYPANNSKKEIYYYIAPKITINHRIGRFELSDSEKLDNLRSKAITGGVSVGRQFSLSSRFNLILGASISYGFASGDTIWNNYFTKNTYLSLGLLPEFQILLPATEKIIPFIPLGGGVSFTHFREYFFSTDNPTVKINYNQSFESMKYSPVIQSGLGFILPVSKDLIINFEYNFRYSKPVFYEYNRDLPLKHIPYSEIFLSHIIKIRFIFRMKN